MRPFDVPEPLANVICPYPEARALLNVICDVGDVASEAVAQLWMSEGIPYAFRECPAIYVSLRTWLGRRLRIHPNTIGLTGSGRIGQSLNPRQIGTPFRPCSDLDLLVVSSELFARLTRDFEQWSDDYDGGVISPTTPAEKRFWPRNRKRVPKNIKKGFLDVKYIPADRRYSEAAIIHSAMRQLRTRLSATDRAPAVRAASIRVYRDYLSQVTQMALNLRTAAKSSQ